MKGTIRYVLLYLALVSNAHAIVLGTDDVLNTYSSVGYTLTTGGAMWLDYGGGEVVAGINSFIFDEADLTDPPGTPNWDDGYWTVGRPPPITRTGSGAMSPTPCSPARPYLSRPRSGCWDPDCWV